MKGIRDDIKQRSKFYLDDWKTVFDKGMKKKTTSAILFMYFACLAPAVAFGGLTSTITNGAMGVREFLISCGASGVFYSIFCGQPMTFQGPTGLTLAFTSALHGYAIHSGQSFMGMYCWTGIWTSFFLALASVFNLSDLINYCTRFTDDCFNALIALNFLSEAVFSIVRGFSKSTMGDFTTGLSSMNLSLIMWFSTQKLVSLKQSTVLNESFRNIVSSFGPSLVILSLTAISAHPTIKALGMETLSIQTSGLSTPRTGFLGAIPMALFEFSTPMRFLAIFPAVLLSILFFLDQNISVRAVNSFKLEKGSANHLDLLTLSVITLLLSVTGLPWTCAATVQSLGHVRSLGQVQVSDETGQEQITDVLENRVSGFVTHALIALSIFAVPLLSQIPVPVITGLFLFLGRKLMKSNLLFERLEGVVQQKNLLPRSNIYRRLEFSTIGKYLSIQSLMLGLIWVLKRSQRLAVLFPSCIALLMIVRLQVLPKIFSAKELEELDPPL